MGDTVTASVDLLERPCWLSADRYGPNPVGSLLFQPLATNIKIFTKKDRIPLRRMVVLFCPGDASPYVLMSFLRFRRSGIWVADLNVAFCFSSGCRRVGRLQS